MSVVLMSFMLGACSTNAPMQKTGQYIDDSVVTARVKAAILENKELKTTEISVETYHGVVQLSGFVKEKSSIPAATNVARSVDGVKSVKNDLLVK